MPVSTSASAAAPRWRGQSERLEVWYATATDPDTGTAWWWHHERVSPTTGEPYRHGWAAVFPPDAAPTVERFGPEPASGGGETRSGDSYREHPWSVVADSAIGDGWLQGKAGSLAWDVRYADASPPVYTFPKSAWDRELLPAAQVVPAPSARFEGRATVGEHTMELSQAHGALAHIYGQGNAHRWGWLHADLGDGDVCEIVAAVSRRPGLRRLPPAPFVQLRTRGRDWPANPLAATPAFRSRLGLPEWTVSGTWGRRRLRVAVTQRPEASVSLDYRDPDGARATCTNSERADAEIVVERWSGRWRPEGYWSLQGTAHAEIGTRP